MQLFATCPNGWTWKHQDLDGLCQKSPQTLQQKHTSKWEYDHLKLINDLK